MIFFSLSLSISCSFWLNACEILWSFMSGVIILMVFLMIIWANVCINIFWWHVQMTEHSTKIVKLTFNFSHNPCKSHGDSECKTTIQHWLEHYLCDKINSIDSQPIFISEHNLTTKHHSVIIHTLKIIILYTSLSLIITIKRSATNKIHMDGIISLANQNVFELMRDCVVHLICFFLSLYLPILIALFKLLLWFLQNHFLCVYLWQYADNRTTIHRDCLRFRYMTWTISLSACLTCVRMFDYGDVLTAKAICSRVLHMFSELSLTSNILYKFEKSHFTASAFVHIAQKMEWNFYIKW